MDRSYLGSRRLRGPNQRSHYQYSSSDEETNYAVNTYESIDGLKAYDNAYSEQQGLPQISHPEPSYAEGEHLDSVTSDPPAAAARFRPWGQLLGVATVRQYTSLPLPRPSSSRHPAGLSSSSPTTDDEEANNSDATFTGSELALARDSTLVLHTSRPGGASKGPSIPPRNQMVRRLGSGPTAPPHQDVNTGNGPMDRDFESSCLARTQSGSVFIPTDGIKCPGTSPLKSDLPLPHRGSLNEEKKSDRCPVGYTTGSVPALPVRNNLRRPMSSHFAHSRFHIRKTLSSRCSWKCTAIAFIFLSIILLTILAYFIAVAVLNWEYAGRQPCPVMVDDMGTTDGNGPKSTYDPSVPGKGRSWVHGARIVRRHLVTDSPSLGLIGSGVPPSLEKLFPDSGSGDGMTIPIVNDDSTTRKSHSDVDPTEMEMKDEGLVLVTKSPGVTKSVIAKDKLVDESSKNLEGKTVRDFSMPGSVLTEKTNTVPNDLPLTTNTIDETMLQENFRSQEDINAGLLSTLNDLFLEETGSIPTPLPLTNNNDDETGFDGDVRRPEDSDTGVVPTFTDEDMVTMNTGPAPAALLMPKNPFDETLVKKQDESIEDLRTPNPGANIVMDKTHLEDTNESLPDEKIGESSTPKALIQKDDASAYVVVVPAATDVNSTSNELHTIVKQETPTKLRYFPDKDNRIGPNPVHVNSKDHLSTNRIPGEVAEPEIPFVVRTTDSSLIDGTSPAFSVAEGTAATTPVVVPEGCKVTHDENPRKVEAGSSTEGSTSLMAVPTTALCPCMDSVAVVDAAVQGSHMLPSKTVPPKSDSFYEVQLGKVHEHSVPSYGHWNVKFYQRDPSLVKFNYTVPSGASIGVYGKRNTPPTHTRYDFLEILSPRERRTKRTSKDTYNVEFIQFLDRGSWYISVYNDGESSRDVSFVPLLTDESSLPCPYDCHGHGNCVMGNCVCDVDYAGDSCAYRVCPVLCSGRGQYVGGECVCSPGWKGKECQIREDECEVSDCSGHGDCLDGLCRCFPGYKGSNCEEVDCLDPYCSGHGVCVSGMCVCKKGWKGADCNEPDSEALRCLPDCSGHGLFDVEFQRCVCDEQWTGPDCSQEKCNLDCGLHGRCQGGECVCLAGWSGLKCNEKLCDPRCLEHGQCKNGSCLCIQGWNGQHCTLEGCPKNCNNHGECSIVENEWQCRCEGDWDGLDCGTALERSCNDKLDNDNDGLIDCADSECCLNKQCVSNPLCFSSADPLDILLRKQPPAVTASFFQRMQFLIEEDSVQSYAHKSAFNDSRASVIRGQVIGPSGSGLTGIRVGVVTDPLFGFTITRETGWFDLMVNGGGAVTLHFQREPFKPHERTVVVPWNEIVVMDKVALSLDETKSIDYKNPACLDHDYDTMKPVVLATWKHGFQGGCPEKSSVLVESQVVQESLTIPGTNLHLVYHTSRMGGYLSTIQLQLTPDAIPATLRLIHLRISIEGILFEKKFEADPGIKFTYAWNRRNIYRQKVYGVATAVVHVGFEYSTCQQIIWDIQTTQVSGHDMSISEIGGWNLDIHHRYNFHEGILQKGDGTNTYLKNKPKVLLTAVGDGQQRSLRCDDCNGVAKKQRLLAPVALAGGPDGSVFVGDFNLIRRITPDGLVSTVVELSAAQVAYRYHLALGPADGKLYISDPERHQVLRAITLTDITDVKTNIEAVVGNGGRCLPGDKMLCGDGRLARDARLAYPKGIAISPYNEIFIADGTNIRMVDRAGIIHTLIGDHYHKSHWKPIPCTRTVSISQVSLRWPTELSINPLDGTLHILDDHMILRLTQDKRLKIVAGRALHCPASAQSRDKTNIATEIFLDSPQSIAFAPNGDLYIAESDSQMINRVRIVGSDGRISKFAGAESKCSCLDINCKCFEEDHYLAATSKLNTISSITVTPNGHLHICDRGNLRIRSVTASLPKHNQFHEYEIYAPETQEIYVFNRHGQHVSTNNILTGKTVYTFSYNVNTSFGKLSTVTDAAGNKIYILRDYSNQVNTIENTQGGKCRLEMSRMRMLQSFTTPDNFKTIFDYHGSTGLIRSKMDSSGRSYVYIYDEYGRLTQGVTPSGQTIRLTYNLSVKGASVTVTRDNKNQVSLLIKGSDVTTRIGMSEERITQYPDGSMMVTSQDSSSSEMETVPSPVLTDLSPVLGETFPVPAKLKSTLSENVVQRMEWRYYLRREGKGQNRQVAQVGRKLKVNGDTLLAVEFDREQYSETVYDRNQMALVTVHYDPLGHPLQWLPNQNITAVKLEYDRFGRLSRWERGSLSERYSFDIQGRLADVRYSDNTGILYKYDEGPTSLPNEIILPSGSRYQMQYDPSGSLQAIITPNGHKHEIATQTSLGFYKLLYIAPGVKRPLVLQYNDRGQILAKLYPKNRGREVYIYNAEGRLESVISGNEKTDFNYHEQTALIKSISSSVPDMDMRVDYRYHGALLKEEKHRYSSRSGMDGAKFKYRYDNRLAGVEVELNGKSSTEAKYRYNAETGLLEQVQQFLIHRPKINSVFIQDEARQYSKTITRDTYGRIVALAMTLWNKEVFSMSLQYDNRSRVKHTKTKVGKEGKTLPCNYTYTADGFLEAVTGQTNWQFLHDINGNMKSVQEGQSQLKLRYDDGDRLIGYGDVELYVVDSRGFVVQRGEEKFRFNAKGHLTMAFELHQYEVHYSYDAFDRLVTRRDHKGNITQFFYADPMNPELVTHVHFPKDSLTYQFVYDINRHLIYFQQGSTKYYVVTSHLGSPLGIFDSDGNVIKEIEYSPFGKRSRDTNSEFYMPVDFQGGIRDSQTQLIHFRGRVYDPLGAQWLTPDWEEIPHLLKEPYKIHLYRFHGNDPINPLDGEKRLTEFSEWLSTLGFGIDKMLIRPGRTIDPKIALSKKDSLPTISGLSCTADIVAAEFYRFRTVPKTEVRVDNMFLRAINFRVANLPSVLGDGILLSRNQYRAVVHVVNEASPIVRDVVTAVFNDTFMVDFFFSMHGQDSFFFVQENRGKSSEDWNQIQRLGTMFNVSLQPVEGSEGQGQADLKMASTSVVLSIRYGTTLEEERKRLLRFARRKAVEEAWTQEAELVRSGQKSSQDWTKAERDELLTTGKIASYFGTDIFDVTKYPQLADDPTNIIFRKESTRKKRGRSRRPK